MNNTQIIASEAVASGFYTEDQIDQLIAEGKDIPFHTYRYFKDYYNMVPQKGSKGWECRLWRQKGSRKDINKEEISDEDLNKGFYLTKTYLFDISQCVPVKEG